MKKCTTHHLACDCREQKFKKLEAENAALREDLDECALFHGMSLRDYFAAATLHGITNLPSVGRYKVHQWAGDWAEWSYAVADAMLAERAKRKEAKP